MHIYFYSKESEREGRRYPFVLTRHPHEDNAQRAVRNGGDTDAFPWDGKWNSIQGRENI
jgi:hypothetical protein